MSGHEGVSSIQARHDQSVFYRRTGAASN